MSEPNNSKMKSMVNTFLSEYNKTSKKKFHWNDLLSYTASSKKNRWCDATVFSKKKEPLYIQHKEVVWDILYDKIRSGKARKLIDKLKQEFINSNLNNCFVSLNFYSIIPEKEDAKNFIFDLIDLVRFNIDKLERKNLKFSYDSIDDPLLDKLKKYISSLDIFKTLDQNGPVIGWGYSELKPRPLPHYGYRVISEINKQGKNHKDYDGIILLLEANTILDNTDLNDIYNGLKEIKPKNEIWIVEDFKNSKKAFKLNPKP